MPFKATYKKDFEIKDKKIYLSSQYLATNLKKFKKITGSRLASILGKNKYTSPLKTWCMMTNIYYEEMDETLSRVGNVIEPKIKTFVEEQLGIKYKQYNPFVIKWDLFSDNPVFGGIPDGEPISDSDEFLYNKGYPMLEIKTTSIDSFVYRTEDNVLKMQKDENNIPLVKVVNGKLDSWFDENKKLIIPTEYELQLSLYLYLRNVSKGLFAVAFLEKEYYANPDSFDPKKARIEFAEIELDRQNFEKIVVIAQEWFEKYITTGISPELTPSDELWLNNLLKN